MPGRATYRKVSRHVPRGVRRATFVFRSKKRGFMTVEREHQKITECRAAFSGDDLDYNSADGFPAKS